MSQRWYLAVSVIGLCLLMLGCPGSFRPASPGTTFGDILVDRPEVYTRERLVTDRLEQDRWLREQLALTDKLVFGVQGLADVRSFQGLAASVGIEANPLLVDLQQAQLANQAAGLDRQEELAELEHRKTKLGLLKQIQGLEEGSTASNSVAANAPTAPGATPPAGGDSKEQQPAKTEEKPPSDPTASGRSDAKSFEKLFEQAPEGAARQSSAAASPIDGFRDKLAYREELRAEIIENALDDRHDLRGNTLYRLKFDATVLPENNSSAWAVVDVKVEGPYDEIDCDQLEDPERRRITEVFEDWKKFMVTYLNSEFGRRSFSQTSDERADLTVRSIEALGGLGDAQRGRLSEAQKTIEGSLDLEANLELLATASDSTSDKEKRRLIASSIQGEYLARGLNDYLRIREFLDLRLEVDFASQDKDGLPSPGLVDKFCQALQSASSAYTYAVTPKESVQRISDVASRREATQVSLALGLVLGSVGLDSLTEYAQATEGIFQAIRRQPLVVGFNESSNGKPDRFGWILGPRFLITPKKDSYFFRHAPVQQSLSAVVSIPSWWDRARITVDKYWRDETGKRNELKDCQEKTSQEKDCKPDPYEVDLPGDPSGIAAALLRGFKRPPIPTSHGSGYHLAIGSPGSLLIKGIDLWRNPAVFVGSQRADRIAVLPDMKGIVAYFDRVAQPAGWAESDASGQEQIDLWTSEGTTFVDYVTLHRPRMPAAGIRRVRIDQARLVGDAIAVLEIDQGALPAAFSNLKIGVRRLHGGTDYAELDPHGIDAKKNIVRARLTEAWLTSQLGSQFAEGVPLQLSLRLKLNPAAQLTVHSADRAPIYYSTPDEAAVKVSPPSAADLPVELTLRFPENVQQGYPGFDPAKVSFTAAVKDNPAIKLDVALAQQSSGIWKARVSADPSSIAAWKEAHKGDQVVTLKLSSGSADLLWSPDSLRIPKGS